MKLLDLYIARNVIAGSLVALLVVLGLDLFITFVGEIDDIGTARYGVLEALQYLLFTVPRRAYEMFPMVTLLGSLVALGTLAGNSELLVFRTAGVSLLRIVGAVMVGGLALAAAAVVLGEWMAPPAERYAQTFRAVTQADDISVGGRQGLWARDGDQYINIRRMQVGGRLEGVHIYRFDGDHRLEEATVATTAVHADGRWVLEDVQQSTISADGVTTSRQDQALWDTLLSPELLDVVVVDPQNLAAWDLVEYMRYLRANGLSAERYELALWMKIMAPVSTLVMLFLAVPFIFGPLRQVGAGLRIVVGILAGVGFYLLNQLLGHLGQVYGTPPALSAVLPTALLLAVGLWAIRRIP